MLLKQFQQKMQDVKIKKVRLTPGWRVTFEDEFEGDALNTSNWAALDNKTHGTFSGTSLRSEGGSGGLGQQDARSVWPGLVWFSM